MLTSTRPDSRLTAGLATVFYRYVCDVNAASCVLRNLFAGKLSLIIM